MQYGNFLLESNNKEEIQVFFFKSFHHNKSHEEKMILVMSPELRQDFITSSDPFPFATAFYWKPIPAIKFYIEV